MEVTEAAFWFVRKEGSEFLARRASTRAPACAGMMATPANILAETTSFPCQVIGTMSPKPTVVRVVRPTKMMGKYDIITHVSVLFSSNHLHS